jgi:perosamine synthetase
MGDLAIHGGIRAISLDQTAALAWPRLTQEDEDAVLGMVRSGDISVSEEPRKLESEFAAFIGMPFALAEVNGTAALHSAFYALGVGPGDEVICPSYTYWASAMPAAALGAKIVFAEIDPRTLNIDPVDLRNRITPRTKAIVVVHLWGLPCDMDAIMELAKEHGVPVVEDAAHSHGAKYHGKKTGALGTASAFSFQASKNMPAGEGGMLLTADEELYRKAIVLGHYRETAKLPEPYGKYQHTSGGFKYRMSPLHAAIARVQLRHLDERNRLRNRNIELLHSALMKLPGFRIPEITDGVERVYYENNIIYDEEATGVPKSELIKALQAEGGQVRGDRYPLLHMQPYFVERGSDPEDLPVTRETVEQVVSLPTFPGDDGTLVRQYIDAFNKVAQMFR